MMTKARSSARSQLGAADADWSGPTFGLADSLKVPNTVSIASPGVMLKRKYESVRHENPITTTANGIIDKKNFQAAKSRCWNSSLVPFSLLSGDRVRKYLYLTNSKEGMIL